MSTFSENGYSDGLPAPIYPRHWDHLPVLIASNQPMPAFTENVLVEKCQPEYWWHRSPSTQNSFKNYCLAMRATHDVRNELTEYQLIREIIWSLLGARASYVFHTVSDPNRLLNNRFLLTDRASLTNVSIESLDAVLSQFARSASHSLLLRTVVDFVCHATGDPFHPCVMAFASGINTYLSRLDRFLHTLQRASRGPSSFTMMNLYVQYLPWSRRTGILAGLVMQITAGHLNQLRQPNVHIRLLDILYYMVTTFTVCTGDSDFLGLLQFLFLQTFRPFLYTTAHLLSGFASIADYSNCLFADPESLTKPTDGDYWSQAFIWHDSLDQLQLVGIPKMFHPVIVQLASSLKALCMLTALSNHVDDDQLLKHISTTPEDIFQTLYLPVGEQFVSPRKHDNDLVELNAIHEYPNDEDFRSFRRELLQSVGRASQQTDDFRFGGDCNDIAYRENLIEWLQDRLRSYVQSRCVIVNRYLVSVMLGSVRILKPGFQNLGAALAAVGAVYFFGSGDRLNDFARDLFRRVRSLEPWYLDHVGLTLQLRGQFEQDTTSTCKTLPAFLWMMRYAFVFRPTPESQLLDGTTGSVFDRFGRIQLCFDAEWPANIVLTEEALSTYNGVFIFLLQIKYVKWSLEHLRFTDIHGLLLSEPEAYHRMLLLRSHMIFVFTGLHDFLVHRVEALRMQFIHYWHLPDVMQVDEEPTLNEVPGDLSHLLATHDAMLSGLKATCLLAASSAMLRTEIETVFRMALTLQSLWLSRQITSRPFETSAPIDVAIQLDRLADHFHDHIQFLSCLLSKSIRLSNMKKLLPLADTFRIAASFRT